MNLHTFNAQSPTPEKCAKRTCVREHHRQHLRESARVREQAREHSDIQLVSGDTKLPRADARSSSSSQAHTETAQMLEEASALLESRDRTIAPKPHTHTRTRTYATT